MDLEIVLNELSFRAPANDNETARQRMTGLLDTIREATHHGVKRSLHIDRDLPSLELAPDYPVARWLNDGQVNRDTRSFFRTLATHLSYIDDLPEYLYQEDQAKGLGFAFQHDHLAVSLDSEACWRSSYMEMEIRYLELDESDQLVSEFVQVKHACSPVHVGEHGDWIKERIRIPVRKGSDIWDHRDELYPGLQFCESVGEQLKDVLSGDSKLRPIMKKLSEFEDFCKNWRTGPFDNEAIPGKVTPESPETLEKYRKVRTFRCPHGQYVVFSWHARLTPGEWRIYFHPIEDKRQLIIGYIGPHLPTVRFK